MYFKLFPARGFEVGTVKSDSLALNMLPSVLGRELDRVTVPMLDSGYRIDLFLYITFRDLCL